MFRAYLFCGILCLTIIAISGQKSLFDNQKHFGASVKRTKKLPRTDRSFNSQRKSLKVENSLEDDAKTVSLFDNKLEGTPDEVGYGQFYTSVAPNSSVLHGQRKDSSNTQIIINLHNQPGSFLYGGSGGGYGKHHKKYKEDEEVTSPAPPAPPVLPTPSSIQFPGPPSPPDLPSPPAPPLSEPQNLAPQTYQPSAAPANDFYSGPSASAPALPQGPPTYGNQANPLLDSYGQYITTTSAPPSDAFFVEPQSPPSPSQIVFPPAPPTVRPPSPPPPGPPEQNRYNYLYGVPPSPSYGILPNQAAYYYVPQYGPLYDSVPIQSVVQGYGAPQQSTASSYYVPQEPTASYGVPSQAPQNNPVSYNPPQEDPTSSYGSPQAPPQQNPVSYNPPPQDPTPSYGAPQAPPQQNPVSYNPPPQDPTPSYGAPQATPQQNPVSYNPPPQDPTPSYGAPQAPPQQNPVSYNPPPQDPTPSYGAPQAPPQQNPVSYNPPPQDPTPSYGAPQTPPQQNPVSYNPPPQDPTPSYGVPQAPPLQNPSYSPPQDPTPTYASPPAPPRDPLPSYDAPSSPPRDERPAIVQQVVPQGVTVSVFPIQQQSQQPQSDFRPSYNSPSQSPSSSPSFDQSGSNQVHYHVHVNDARDLPAVEQALNSPADSNDNNNDSGYGAPSVISSDQTRNRNTFRSPPLNDQLTAPQTPVSRSLVRSRVVRVRRPRPSYGPPIRRPPSQPRLPPRDLPFLDQTKNIRDHLLFKCVIWCGLSHTQFYDQQQRSLK